MSRARGAHSAVADAASDVDIEDLARRIEVSFPPLTTRDRRIGLATFRELVRGRPAEASAITTGAGVPSREVTDALDRWPSVYRDDAGRVVGFWGLTLEGTRHVIHVAGQTLSTWCAWDALLLPELVEAELRVESSCAATGRPVELIVAPDGLRRIDPPTTVISFVAPEACDVQGDCVISTFCDHILFFETDRAYAEWAAGHPQPTFRLSAEEGWHLGRIANRLRYGAELARALRTP